MYLVPAPGACIRAPVLPPASGVCVCLVGLTALPYRGILLSVSRWSPSHSGSPAAHKHRRCPPVIVGLGQSRGSVAPSVAPSATGERGVMVLSFPSALASAPVTSSSLAIVCRHSFALSNQIPSILLCIYYCYSAKCIISSLYSYSSYPYLSLVDKARP